MRPKIFKGGISSDHRGTVSFNNSLILSKIKILLVENFKKKFTRLGMHKIEAKYILCIGKAKFQQ